MCGPAPIWGRAAHGGKADGIGAKEMKRAALIGVLLVAAPLWAFHRTPAQQYAHLAAQAAKAHGHKRAELLAKLAFLDFGQARQGFETNHPAVGRQKLAALQEHGAESMRLLRGEAARGKKDGMRHVEIDFRRIAFGLATLEHEADFRDQPVISAAQQRFAQWRRRLLAWLFAKKKNGHLILSPDQGK